MRLYNEHILTFRIDFGKRKSENCIHGQNPQRRRDFAGTGLARGSCRQCIHWYLMYNGAHHKNIGVLGRHVEEPEFWRGGSSVHSIPGNLREIYCTVLLYFGKMHAIDITVPDGSIVKELKSNL